jgi:hypothetical protein
MTTINDPKGEAGSKKAPMWLLPPVALEQTAWVHKLGNEKYGPFNWRATGVCATTYVSAILRHLNAWRDGEDLDPESGISHIAHIATSCNILMDAEACGTLQDDRNKRPAGLSREEAFQQLVGCDLGAPLSPVVSQERDDFEAVKDPTVRVVDHDIKPGDRVTGRLVRGEDFSGTVVNIIDIRGTKLFQFLDRSSISEDEIFSLTHA